MDLLIIADDFTGALDTGVQFATAGIRVKVTTNADFSFQERFMETRVLVLDVETRPIGPNEAYRRVYDIVRRAREAGVPYILKKTDSGLRGNIGAELSGLLDASGLSSLAFLPACPQMNRTTKNGIHYIDGVPVNESVFGKDPFEPVTESDVKKIIHMQCQTPVEVVPEGKKAPDLASEKTIHVYDTETTPGLEKTAAMLAADGKLSIMAGCAGLAAVLPGLLGLHSVEKRQKPLFGKGFLVACGSVNPISKKQLDRAVEAGFGRQYLTPPQKLEKGYWESDGGKKELQEIVEKCRSQERFIIDSNDLPGRNDTKEYAHAHGMTSQELRHGIAASIGGLIKHLMEEGIGHNLMLIGGDTLLGFLRQMGVQEVEPVCEMAPGTVLSKFMLNGNSCQILSKSGGFGQERLLSDLYQMFFNQEKEGE